MAITYNYLEEGTAFTAVEFNDRFEALMGFETGVNALNPESLQLGALRHNHLPALVGPSGKTGDELLGGFTSETTRLYLNDNLPGPHAVSIDERDGEGHSAGGDPNNPLLYHAFNSPIYLRTLISGTTDEGPTDNVDAFIILANVHLNRFIEKGSQVSAAELKRSLRERSLGAVFTLHLSVSYRPYGSTAIQVWIPLLKAQKMVSPGFTIDYNSGTNTDSGYPMDKSGVSSPTDRKVNKDIALRTVVRKGPLLDLVGSMDAELFVEGVALTGCLIGAGRGDVKGRVDKMNMTVIPIHTKVSTHGGS